MASQPLKYTVTHYRKKNHTQEEFIKWIVEVHLVKAIPIFQRHGIIEYSIFTTPEDLNMGLQAQLGPLKPAWQFADFDCFLEYIIPDVQAIQNVMMDPDWPEAIRDQEDWVDTSRALVSLGYLTPYLLKTGEVVNMPQ
ncbi:hypothetical protein B0I35DRAFT_514724 [Stachybotrys elegans]|uniref:EthD domain-containing protein n=1 Tax=Stachybotrys elegans TaxID=80388 RepID=A0A8K0SI27_9HYPO|nr:hypothetical protein B0I35DRAFT_514724 [Stachybotrys elegans]